MLYEVITHDVAHRRNPRAMAPDPRHTALARPAAVSVHDDGDVEREFLGLNIGHHPGLSELRLRGRSIPRNNFV